MAEFNGKQGAWRTVGGRKIFIVDGEDLATAMKNSGKFKNKKEENKNQIETNKKILYHSSNFDFNEFDDEKADSSFIEGNYGPGHYFFDNKELSDGYGAYNKYHYEVEVDTKGFLHIKDDMHMLGQKNYKDELNKRGYNGEENKRKFMLKNNIPGLVIEHKKYDGKVWNEYVVFEGNKIKIKNKSKL